MTVIAWDGRTLAADKRGTNCGWVFPVTKIHSANGCLVGISGNLARGLERLAWFASNATIADYPRQDDGDSGYLFVVRPDRTIAQYEQTGHPIIMECPTAAAGSARDFALAAMACGKTAREAVEVACALSSACGNGVDTLTFDP
jgi:hypothetical protein